MIHLFKEHLFDEFIEYINNVKTVFSLVTVIFTININSDFDKVIKNYDPNFIIIKIVNKGVDIYPFIESIKYIRENNIKSDYILKLHTKESNLQRFDFLEWRKQLIEPITNINNLYIIQHYFKNVKNIGFVGAQRCVLPKNFDLDFMSNIIGINQLCDKFPHLEKNWTDFVAGTMFWINNEVLDKYLTNELINYLSDKFIYDKPPSNYDSNAYIEYLCERMFTGIFCYSNTNILVNEFSHINRGISHTCGYIDNKYFYQPNIFSFNIPKNNILNLKSYFQ